MLATTSSVGSGRSSHRPRTTLGNAIGPIPSAWDKSRATRVCAKQRRSINPELWCEAKR